jgi:hypothetical protein
MEFLEQTATKCLAEQGGWPAPLVWEEPPAEESE